MKKSEYITSILSIIAILVSITAIYLQQSDKEEALRESLLIIPKHPFSVKGEPEKFEIINSGRSVVHLYQIQLVSGHGGAIQYHRPIGGEELEGLELKPGQMITVTMPYREKVKMNIDLFGLLTPIRLEVTTTNLETFLSKELTNFNLELSDEDIDLLFQKKSKTEND